MNPLYSALIGIATSGALWAPSLYFLNRKESKRAQKEEKDEQRRDDQRKRDETWFREADGAYKRVEDECTRCRGELRRLHSAFYGLVDDLNDIDGQDIGTLRAQVRSATRRARAAADWDPNTVVWNPERPRPVQGS
jgi:hypothetical protein